MRKKSSLLLLAVLVVWCPALLGQTTFGSIGGTVIDSSGAAVPHAQVTLTNKATSEKRSVTTDAVGNYQFVDLIPDPYRIDIEVRGFKHFTRDPVAVEVNQSVRIDSVLELGEITETVEVTAQTPLLQPSTSDLGQVIATRQVNELPLNGRNPMNLVALAPSVVPQGQSQGNPVGKNPFDYSNYQIGGAITNQGAEYLDGVPLNNSYINELSLIPTQDSLQEFKVQTNNLNAEWGRFAGGVINFTTKSGSNSLHGTVYEYLRNTHLNARDFFIPNRGAFHQNQYGLNVGGPVYLPNVYDGRNKTFFFFSWEGFRQRIGQTFVESVPTRAEKNGDFTNYRDPKGNLIPIYDPTTTTGGTFTRQQFGASAANNFCTPVNAPGCNIIPSALFSSNQAVQFMLKEFPDPNATPVNSSNASNYVASSSGGGNNGEIVARADRNLSDKQRLFVRYSRWTNLNFPIDPFKNGVCQDRCTEKFLTHNIVADDVYNFSPTTIMDLRVSYGRLAYDRIPAGVGIDLSQLGPNWAPLNNQVVLRDLPIPDFTGGPDSFLNNVFTSQGAGSVITARDDTPRIAGSLTNIHGRHTLQFGGEYRIDHHNYLQTNVPVGKFNFNANFTQFNPTTSIVNGLPTGSAFASFLLGYGADVSQNYVNPVASQQRYPALYAQDQFKATSKLTLNLGVRWEQNGPYSERFDRISFLEPNAAANLPQPPCSILPAATAAAFGASQVCLPALKGELGLAASSQRPERYGQNKPWKQFSPHFGFAYQWNPKTVVRGGYGLFWISNAVGWNETPNNDGVNSINTPWITSVDGGNTPCVNPATGVGVPACPGGATFNLSNPFPNGILQPPGRNLGLYQSLRYGQGPTALLPDNPYAYYQQWNLNVQRELPDGTLIDLAYAGSKGAHLPDSSQQINALPDNFLSLGTHLRDQVPNPFLRLLGPNNITSLNTAKTVQLQQLLLPFPQYTGYSISAAGLGSSIYHSMQLKLEKQMKGSGVLLVAYTISKMITSANIDTLTNWLEAGSSGGIQDWNNLKNERSLSSFDVPQRLVVSYVVDLPVGRGKRFLSNASGVSGKLVSGWGLEGVTTYQRGFPLNFGTTGVSQGQNLGTRPIKLQSAALSGSAESRLTHWFNNSVCPQPGTSCTSQPNAAWALPVNFTFGNESRVDPVLRAQGIQNWDFSIFKDTRFGPEDRLGLQFRTEFFNLFNKPQFGPPNRTVGSGNFGIVNSTVNNPRLIQFALRLTF